jgi:hypothetical protein
LASVKESDSKQLRSLSASSIWALYIVGFSAMVSMRPYRY